MATARTQVQQKLRFTYINGNSQVDKKSGADTVCTIRNLSRLERERERGDKKYSILSDSVKLSIGA